MTPLAERVQQLSHPLAPEPTGEQPVLPRLPGIRAVVFDVYGTLLVSGSGDISLASEGGRGSAAEEALAAVGIELPDDVSGDAVVESLHAAIHTSHSQLRAELTSCDYPEVEIREVWRTVLRRLDIEFDDQAVELLSVEYECRVNPIWPMPGLDECLTSLGNAEFALGIVSNAQFFTPLAFPALTGRSLVDWRFSPELCEWSYAQKQAKPGLFLYERSVAGLRSRGISPKQTLYVGNDLRNDVWPAQRVGMQTALFAGDRRSLRWRADDPRVADVRPEAVVTDLRQIMSILSLADG